MADDGEDAGQQTAEWKPPASQADLDRIITDRIARERAKFADYDDAKAKAGQYDELVAATRSDTEKAVDEARNATSKETREATIRELAEPLAEESIRVHATGKLSDNQLKTVLDGLNLSRFLTDKGRVDTVKVAAFVNALVPAVVTKNGPSPHGQATREQVKLTGAAAGMAEAERRYGKQTSTT
ncbi:MAG: hypothetical protein ACR2GG_10660 [Gemmatimonadaceae bacterium]